MAAKFECPESMQSHCKDVLRGSYDVPGLEFAKPPSVLDIGANLGAFSIWATRRWKGCAVLAVEPHPENYKLLCRNVASFPVSDVRQAAVVAPESRATVVTLYEGKNNCGEASFEKGPEQSDKTFQAQALRVDALPKCDVLKVDAEGAEMFIVVPYVSAHHPVCVLYEAHSASNRHELAAHMLSHGYDCISDRQIIADESGNGCDRWVAKWCLPGRPEART